MVRNVFNEPMEHEVLLAVWKLELFPCHHFKGQNLRNTLKYIEIAYLKGVDMHKSS